MRPNFPAEYAVMLMLQMPVVGSPELYATEAALLAAFTRVSGAPAVNVVRAYTKWMMHGRGNDAIQVILPGTDREGVDEDEEPAVAKGAEPDTLLPDRCGGTSTFSLTRPSRPTHRRCWCSGGR